MEIRFWYICLIESLFSVSGFFSTCVCSTPTSRLILYLAFFKSCLVSSSPYVHVFDRATDKVTFLNQNSWFVCCISGTNNMIFIGNGKLRSWRFAKCNYCGTRATFKTVNVIHPSYSPLAIKLSDFVEKIQNTQYRNCE